MYILVFIIVSRKPSRNYSIRSNYAIQMGMNNGGGCTYKVFSSLAHEKRAVFIRLIRLLFFSYFYFRRSEISPYKILYMCMCVCMCVNICQDKISLFVLYSLN